VNIEADVLIVGGGTGGCVTASRLSASAGCRVLLIEAGMDTPPGKVPAEILDSYPMPLFHGTRYLWPDLSAGITARPDGTVRQRFYEQGRVMGGSSSVNVQAANRGLPRDYDAWAELGCNGWNWEQVLPYFKKLEHDQDFRGPLHGSEGPLPIRRILPNDWPSFADAVSDAVAAGGYEKRLDQNADFEDGVFPPAFSNFENQRVSAAAAYLTEAVRSRPNLSIMADTQVLSLTIERQRAIGARLRSSDGSLLEVRASTIVVCAGALQGPGLLMRAGVGRGSDLQKLGIPVQADRPGVGANLRDHPGLTICQYLPKRLRLETSQRRASLSVLRYSSNLPGGSASDMYLSAAGRAGWHELGARLALYFLWINQPHSVGHIVLKSPEVHAPADIQLNLLSDERDMNRLCAGLHKLLGLLLVPGLNPNPAELFPATYTPAVRQLNKFNKRNHYVASFVGQMLDGPPSIRHWMFRTFNKGMNLSDLVRDELALTHFVRENVAPIWHPSGTCRMGAVDDPMTVVDPTGRVLGIEGLYVSDASIMPRLPTANTNIPTMMLAEKISDGLVQTLQFKK
jgi:5-(hydroxymethyl)furfural/furfural oxidase